MDTEINEDDFNEYHCCLFLIQTLDNSIFGAFITASPTVNDKQIFCGTEESFVFRIVDNQLKIHHSVNKNEYYLLCL
jgi:hypothetical protein